MNTLSIRTALLVAGFFIGLVPALACSMDGDSNDMELTALAETICMKQIECKIVTMGTQDDCVMTTSMAYDKGTLTKCEACLKDKTCEQVGAANNCNAECN